MADKRAYKKKPDTSDLSSKAAEYMDLWQKQLSAMASDETVASMMAQTAQLMNNSAEAVAAMATQQKKQTKQTGTSSGQDSATGATTGGTAGTETAGASSGVDDHAVDRLTERLERLEERITALERGTVKTGK